MAKRSLLFVSLILVVIFMLSTFQFCHAYDPVKGFSLKDKVVLTYYYIWFTEDWWVGEKSPTTVFMEGINPLIGAYNSWDPWVIDKHLSQMRRAKIDAIAVSWRFSPGEKGQNLILDRVYEIAQKYDLKVTIDFEGARGTMDGVYKQLYYYLNRYKDHPAMLKVEGASVVMIWTASAHTPEEWQNLWDKLEAEGIRTFPIMSGGYGSGRGVRYLGPFRSLEIYTLVDTEDSELASVMQGMRKNIDDYNKKTGFKIGKPAQHHATISPGYDESKLPGRKTSAGGTKGAGWKNRGNFGVNFPDDPVGAYYRGTFEAAMSSNPDWIHISTFNELYEWSHIEPTIEFGYKYIDMTADFVREFKGK